MPTVTRRHQSGSYLTPAFEHATVADAMHPGVLSCDAEATIDELARIMATHHVHCIAVMGLGRDESGETLAWGIVSDLDLVRAAADEDTAQTARALARHPIVVVEPAMPLRDAGRLMSAEGAAHVLVVDPAAQHPVGVLSTLDVAGVLAWGEG